MKLATALINQEEKWGIVLAHPQRNEDWLFFPAACERIFQRCAAHATNGMNGCLQSFAPTGDWPDSLEGFLALEERGMEKLRALERHLQMFLRRGDVFAIETAGWPLSQVTLCPPIPRPRLMLGLVQNSPSFWRKNPNRQIANFFPQGHQRPVGSLLGEGGTFGPVDGYNVELGVIIGKEGKDIPVEQARSYVAGYTVVIDGCHGRFWDSFFQGEKETRAEMCARLGWHLDACCSWGGKKADARCAVGPWMVTADEIGDVYDLLVYTLENNVVRDRSHTAAMSIGVERTIHFFSTFLTLRPGDILHMGTMGTDGLFQDLPVPVTKDTLYQAEIEGIGRLSAHAVHPEKWGDWRCEEERRLPLSPAVRYLGARHQEALTEPWTMPMARHVWLCLGNYQASEGIEQMPATPYPRFLNAPASCAAQNAAEIRLAKRAGRLSVDVQLAFVVKRMACQVKLEDADKYIEGYCAALSVTDYSIYDQMIQPATPQEMSLSQVYGRWGDGYNDLGALGRAPTAGGKMKLTVQNKEALETTLAEYRHSPAEILHFISQGITLFPGDVILCGRLSGQISLHRNDCQNGCVVTAEIEGLPPVSTMIRA